jgi:hypothetical protein
MTKIASLKDDLLSGVKAIAAFIGEEEQTVGRLIRNGHLPAFRRGKMIFARKSEIEASFRSEPGK